MPRDGSGGSSGSGNKSYFEMQREALIADIAMVRTHLR